MRVSTGEDWIGIMHDTERRPTILFECVNKQSYEEKMRDGIQGCGVEGANAYFIAFILMVNIVVLNLFIAIILEGFAKSAQETSIRVSDECFDAFKRAWLKYDPNATEMLHVSHLEDLIVDLIVEELEIIKKNSSKDSVNFNLHKSRILLYYTKWKRNLLDDEDR